MGQNWNKMVSIKLSKAHVKELLQICKLPFSVPVDKNLIKKLEKSEKIQEQSNKKVQE